MDKQEEEKYYVLGQITAAFNLLQESAKVYKLLPETRSNLVMALAGALSHDQVAGIPGRITSCNMRLAVMAYPQWGASVNSATIVLYIMNKAPERRSVIELKFREEYREQLESQGISTGTLDDVVKNEAYRDVPQVLFMDPSFAMEGSMIVSGDTAVQVAELVLRICDILIP